MKVCVCGSRTLADLTPQEVWAHVDTSIDEYRRDHGVADSVPVELLIHGGARGIDTISGEAAKLFGVPVKVYPAHWFLYGKRAGHLRNMEMAMDADLIVAIWDGESVGTQNMMKFCKKMKKPLYVVRI